MHLLCLLYNNRGRQAEGRGEDDLWIPEKTRTYHAHVYSLKEVQRFPTDYDGVVRPSRTSHPYPRIDYGRLIRL